MWAAVCAAVSPLCANVQTHMGHWLSVNESFIPVCSHWHTSVLLLLLPVCLQTHFLQTRRALGCELLTSEWHPSDELSFTRQQQDRSLWISCSFDAGGLLLCVFCTRLMVNMMVNMSYHITCCVETETKTKLIISVRLLPVCFWYFLTKNPILKK